MRTIETIATVLPDGTLQIQVGNIPPGDYRLVLVLDEQPIEPAPPKRPPFDMPVIDLGLWPEGLSLNREDWYDYDEDLQVAHPVNSCRDKASLVRPPDGASPVPTMLRFLPDAPLS